MPLFACLTYESIHLFSNLADCNVRNTHFIHRSTSYKDQFDDHDVDDEGNPLALVKRFTWTEKSIYKKYDARGSLQKCWKRVRQDYLMCS